MSNNICPHCGKKLISGFSKYHTLADGQRICDRCLIEMGLDYVPYVYDTTTLTYEFLLQKAQEESTRMSDLQSFTYTQNIENIVLFNDDLRVFIAAPRLSRKIRLEEYQMFNYSQLVDCDIIEDGETEGTAGSALLGGLLFGTTGAVIGASRQRDYIMTSLKVQLVLKDSEAPYFYIDLMGGRKPRYDQSTLREIAREIVAKLRVIIDENLVARTASQMNLNTAPPVDAVSEIRRYKELLDEGLITEEEFIAMKRRIMGL